MSKEIIIKNDVANNWNASTTPLHLGEMGYDSTNHILKIGDGSSLWAGLPNLGACTDAGVTCGTFCGRNNTSVSINVGTASAKKILIFCESGKGAYLVNAKCIYSLVYDFDAQKGSLTYQGRDAGYIGSQTESSFDVSYTTVGNDYIYTITHTDTANDRLFQDGLTYSWYCIAHDVPANYNPQEGNIVSGSFVGDGTSTATFYIGVETFKKIYIACTPSTTVAAPSGTIFSLYYFDNPDNGQLDGSIAYQGSESGYVGRTTVNNIAINSSNGNLTIGSATPFATFANGTEYSWIVTSDDSCPLPSGTINITQNGNNIDVAQYAFANVAIENGGFTQMTTGTYTAPSSDTLLSSSITINCGFKPRVFVFCIQGAVQQDNNTNLKVTTSFFTADESGNIIYAGTNFAYKASNSSSNCNSGYTENTKNIFYPSSTGVYASTADNVYLKGGAKYKWFALG